MKTNRLTSTETVYKDYIRPDRRAIAVALLSIKELTNVELAVINIGINTEQDCRNKNGFEKVKHLFKKDGTILHSLITDAFSMEINRRIRGGEWGC